MANPDFSIFRLLDISTRPPFVLSAFCHFILSSFRPLLSTFSIRLLSLIPLFVLVASFRPAEAQVMHLEIRVDPEFGLGDLIMPDLTAQAAPGDGLVETAYDHENAGQLTLHTTENVHLIVTLTSPDYLIRDKENRLPLDLRLAYAHPVFAGPLNLNPVADTTTAIRMNPGNLLINDMLNPPLKFETYLLLYGSVDVGDVSPGVYEGTVHLRVEYP